jgi:hypothetical protein
MGADLRSIRSEVAHLADAVRQIPTQARALMHTEGAALKKTLQSEAQGVAHAPGLPGAITFESGAGRELFYEAGPVEGGAGSLALLYFGNSRTGPRLKDPRFALERQAKQTDAKLLALIERLG